MISPPLLFASIDSGIVVPIAVFVFVLTIVFISLYFRQERRRLWHETARIALEKGQPLPPSDDIEPRRSPLRDVRKALILLAVSAGLYFGLRGQDPKDLIGCYVIGGIAIAFLLNALITALFAPKSTDTNPRAPQA